MLANLFLIFATAFQVGPFYQQRGDYAALRPFYASQDETTDVLWPVYTHHRDWWRFCYFVHHQDYSNGGYQFEIMPLWFNGDDGKGDSYAGLFPIYGHHPHILMMYDIDFCLWPIWMRYRMPRPSQDTWMTSNVVLFPLIHWRSDGSWGFWPLYGTSHNRADDHSYLLWPILNWKTSFKDRDTGGEGRSWMFWPLCGGVSRERENQWLFLPPLFSYAETPNGWRGRYPWPIVEIERFKDRSRTSVFPLYERIVNYRYFDGAESTRLHRFGWRIVEILPNETRVFPFWVKSDDYFRLWPFWEQSTAQDGVTRGRFFSLFPIRWVDAVDRNWAKFWTFYEIERDPVVTRHSLFWGIIRWSTYNE